ncbi:unnamed protein product [Lymnaea stagnalis]|uniref:Uncharacterized protein n=1 Tax=Lymnaea stagnalis TaxID=6523 RepID=A0AAV2HYQ6_LYMST
MGNRPGRQGLRDDLFKGHLKRHFKHTDQKTLEVLSSEDKTWALTQHDANLFTFKSEKFPCGHHEVEESCDGESDLLRRKAACTKNPGHAHFIPVASFTIHHLPEPYRTDEVHELILLQAALTVKVTVTCTSPHRPEFYAESEAPFPFFGRSRDTLTRTGTGFVRSLALFNENECVPLSSSEYLSSSTQWQVVGVIEIQTSSHVVYDDVEVKQTTCALGYDAEDGSGVDIGGFEYKRGMWVDESNMVGVVDDLGVAIKLAKNVERYRELCENLRQVYGSSDADNRLAVMASHPHGCCKLISIGELTRETLLYRTESVAMYNYTVHTCPGCSGAYVYIMGNSHSGLNQRHMGVNAHGNHSGEGLRKR